MSRTKHFIGGVFWGYTQQVLVTVTGLWLTPFLLRQIGQHDYGLWLVSLQILTWLGLMDFGIVALLPRETAYSLGRAGSVGAATDLPELIRETARLVVWQWPIVMLCTIACCFFLPSSAALRPPIIFVACTFVITFPLRICRAVLEGLQQLQLIGIVTIISWVAGILTTIMLVLRGLHLFALATGWAVTQLLSSFLYAVYLKIKYPSLIPNRLMGAKGTNVKTKLGSGLWVSISQLAQVLVDATDLSIIGKASGAGVVVPYSCTGKLIGVLSNQPLMVMHSALPGLSAIKSGGNREHAFQVVVSLTQALLLMSGVVVCVVIAVNKGFVGTWVGDRQFAGMNVTLLLAVSMLLRHWNTTAVYSIFCFGYERRISITTLLDGFVTITASFVLVRRFGSIGAPIGSILGVCLVSLPGNLIALSHESQRTILAVCAPLWPWFWRFLLLASVIAIAATLKAPSTPVGLAVVSATVGSVYTLVMLPILLRSSLRKYIPHRLLEGWKRWNRTCDYLESPIK